MRDEWERHGVSHIRSLHLRSLRSLRHPFASVSTAVSLFLSYLRLSLRSFLGSHVTRLISSSSTRSSFTSVSRLLVPLSLGPPSLCSLVSASAPSSRLRLRRVRGVRGTERSESDESRNEQRRQEIGGDKGAAPRSLSLPPPSAEGRNRR